METPDANGYVNVQWPSKHIPHGGIFHTRIAEPSESQQKYLKVLLEEQRLSIAQRQKSAWRLREQEPEPEAPPPPKQPLVRPRTSRRRPLSAIRESGVFELEPYQPIKRGEDRELLKSKLARSMEHGSEPQEQPPPLKPPRVPKPKPKLPTNEEKRNELLTQIRERAEWLAEMEVLGHAEPHRDIVHDQIAERMRALDMYGIDSVCSSARSHRSGFSTNGEYAGTARSKGSSSKSQRSNLSAESKEKQRSRRSSVKSTEPKEKQKSRRNSVKGKSNKAEETVSAYSNIPPLQFSPRRRV